MQEKGALASSSLTFGGGGGGGWGGGGRLCFISVHTGFGEMAAKDNIVVVVLCLVYRLSMFSNSLLLL